MVDMIQSPFMWGTDGKPRSPAQVKQQRDVAAALLASAPQGKGWASALGEAVKGLSAGINNNQAGIYEQQGLERAGELFAGIGPESESSVIAAALADPAAIWATPAQSGVAEALLGEQMRRNSPDYALDLAYKQAQLDALNAPAPYDPWANTKIVNDQIIGWGENGPQIIGDFRSPDSPLVTIDNGGNSGAFNKKGDEIAAERHSGYISEGNSAQQMMGDLNALAALGSQIDTGKTAEVMNVLGPYAEAIGISIDGLSEGQAFKSIVDRMAPQMRPAGSGSSSDTDVKMFLNSLPSLGKEPGGNQIIMETLSALQQQKIAAAEISARTFLPDGDPQKLSWIEADNQIRALGNPYERFNEYRKRTGIDVQNGQVIDAGNGITIRRLP